MAPCNVWYLIGEFYFFWTLTTVVGVIVGYGAGRLSKKLTTTPATGGA